MNVADIINSLSGEQVFCCAIFLTILYMLASIPAAITEIILELISKRKEKSIHEKSN